MLSPPWAQAGTGVGRDPEKAQVSLAVSPQSAETGTMAVEEAADFLTPVSPPGVLLPRLLGTLGAALGMLVERSWGG